MLIIFDLDNTLIDRNKAYLEWFREWYTTKHTRAMIDNKLLSKIMDVDNNGECEPLESGSKILSLIDDKTSTAEEYWAMSEALIDFIRPCKDVNQCLDTLSNRYQLALLTNGSINRQEKKLKNSALAKYFDLIRVSGGLGFKKPEPEAFASIYDHFNRAPEECLMVGDSEANDIAPAKELGMRTVKVSGFLHNDKNRSIADVSINHVSELMSYLHDQC